MILITRLLTVFCALLLFALEIGNPPPVQAQTYICKQADGSEIMTNAPAGGACKLFKKQGGTASQAPSRDELKVQELLERQRRETEAMQRQAEQDAQRRAAEAQRLSDGVFQQQMAEAQQRQEVRERRAVEEADRRAEETRLEIAANAQRWAAYEAERRAAAKAQQRTALRATAEAYRQKAESEKKEKSTARMIVRGLLGKKKK